MRELIFPSVTAVVAVIGVYLSGRQIRMSNKQHLFDLRLKSWLIVKGLIDLYESSRSGILKDEDSSPIFSIDSDFEDLTNNTYLEKVTSSISTAMDSPEHRALLYKLEEMKSLSVEFKLLFGRRLKHEDTSEGEISKFIFLYQTLLFRMYQYKLVYRKMEDQAKKYPPSLEEAQKAVREPKYRETVMNAFRSLEESYRIIKSKGIESKIITEIRL